MDITPIKVSNGSERFVVVEEAAIIAGCSASTIWRLSRSGGLPSVKHLGRRLFPLSAVEQLAGRRTDADPTAP